MGGANSIVLNNIFAGIPASALRRVRGGSIAAYNLFWQNLVNAEESVVDTSTSVFADPLLTTDLALSPSSPVIDAGTASFQWNGEQVLSMPAGSYSGTAPDLGFRESTSGGPAPNQAPTVNAGPDQTVTQPGPATLDATVTDDGQPGPVTTTWTQLSGPGTTTWTQLSGPGTTTFTNPTAVDTTATFSTAGTYQLKLTANDGELTASDTIQITTQAAPPSGAATLERRITTSTDDAEEAATGSFYATSSDLELVYDGTNQLVGLRFPNLTIPAGATITNAYLQFETDETQTEPTTLTIAGQATDNAQTFTTATKMSTRARTTATTTWTPPWTLLSEAGPNQRTPDLSPAIQQIINRPGWTTGNAPRPHHHRHRHRTARAYDGKPTAAPLLHLEYATG